jgi:hypothetical protein
MPYTTYLDGKLNKQAFGATVYTAPVTVYMALSTTTPAADGTNFTEPSGNNYSRVAITNNTTNFVAATSQPGAGQAQANGTVFSMPQASGSWGTCTYVGLYDASSAGNLLVYGVLGTPQTIANGDTLSLAIQALVITAQ